MNISDCLVILAILIAPFLAVYAQKKIEDWRSRKGEKLWIFKTLMATRRSILSAKHVQALNMIDIVFSDKNKKEREVKRVWKEYLDHLASLPENPEKREAVLPAWSDKNIDYLANLLQKMGGCFGYDFDKVYIKKGIYLPKGHAQEGIEKMLIRFNALQVLSGKKPLLISLVSPDEKITNLGQRDGKKNIKTEVEKNKL